MKIEFIDYTGSYPNLCSGELTLKIDGEITTFGRKNSDYPRFWDSGGGCGFHGYYEDTYVEKAEWIWSAYGEEFIKLKKFLPFKDEIMKVFNKNVEFGCCGGCL